MASSMTRTPLRIASWPADGRRWSLWPTAASRCSSFCTWRRTRPCAAKARRRWSWCCPCFVPCHPLHLRKSVDSFGQGPLQHNLLLTSAQVLQGSTAPCRLLSPSDSCAAAPSPTSGRTTSASHANPDLSCSKF